MTQGSGRDGTRPLVGLAHGSRDPRAAVAIDELMAAVAALRPGLPVASAFLDLSEPDLSTAVARLDVPEAVVVPLLFAQAFHARIDVPQAVVAASARTGTELVTSEIIGLGPDVLGALQDQARQAGITADQEILLLAVGTSDAAANAAIDDLAQLWSSGRRGPVRAVFATTAPRATDALAESWTTVPGVVSLFLAPGLLLDQVRAVAEPRGVVVTPPLGTAMARSVLDRYDAAVLAARSAGTVPR
ncbi:Sirohydrochlorin ferrochelatase [Nakamurella panacisegetis]|uniref:Sirohydrochlorin ferrochelatase n=1 Tax=Nakamurella panacisegetis TaxID=1090615 RepID=A0A1H0IC61_9ACTN|nr:CbiX/SirB N-terminal domain-containing protein [Nakamurella panacisegetis]SDO29049.1 Sirohydrochlorin ferrochelatase [Nakamurella panacisegetis]